MDKQTEAFLRNAPGSIGDTARAYATGFNQLAPVRITDEKMFNHCFQSILLRREKVSDENTIAQGNLLLPVHSKGVNEILRIYDIVGETLELPFKLDLPTITLYSMILESASYRIGFGKMSSKEILDPLEIIYKEIYKICPHQVTVSIVEFEMEHAFKIKDFLEEIDKPRKSLVSPKIFSGKSAIPMSKLNQLLFAESKVIFTKVFNLSLSYSNVLQLLGKNYVVTPENILVVYAETIKYYNAGFAKETGTIQEPKLIINDYDTLINLMFSEEFGDEKTVMPMKGINANEALLDVSLFTLYTLLINFKNIRVALWEAYHTGEVDLFSFKTILYQTSADVLKKNSILKPSIPFDKWNIVALNIIWNIKEFWELLDE